MLSDLRKNIFEKFLFLSANAELPDRIFPRRKQSMQ